MFPQLPFGYLNNTKIAEINSSIFLQPISIQSYVGAVKDCISDVTISNTNSASIIGLLRYATSNVTIDELTLLTLINLVTQPSWRGITQDEWRSLTQDQWRGINQ